MRPHLPVHDLASIEQSDEVRPTDVQHVSSLLSRELRMSRDDGDALARSHVGEDSSQELHGAARNDEFFDAVLDDETHERRFLRLTSEVCLDVRECRSRYLNTLVFRKAGLGCCRHRASSLLYSQHPQHSQQTQRPFHGTYRYLRIDNTGTVKQGFALTVVGVTNGTDNAWASDPSLRITVTRCAVAWTEATNSCGNSPATRHHDTAGQHRQRQLPGADRRGPVRGDVPAGQAGTGRQRPEQRPGAQREGPAHRDRDAAGRNPAMTRKR